MKRLIYIFFVVSGLNLAISAHATNISWRFVEKVDEIELYKSQEKTDGLIPFQAIAELNIPFNKVMMALVNTEKKHAWAPKLKKVKIHNELSIDRYELSEYYKVPWPFYDREFLLLASIHKMGKSILFKGKNLKKDHLASNDHLVADVRLLELKITPLNINKTRIEFEFLGNMGGWIPTFVINIIQKKWPVRFIQALAEFAVSDSNTETQRFHQLSKALNL